MDSDLYIFDGSSSSSSICQHSSISSDTTDLFSNNPYDQSIAFFDDFTPTPHLLSSSPPISQLQTLTLSHTNNFPNFSAFDTFESSVKTEQFPQFMARSYNADERFMQRSFSSNSVDGKPEFVYNSPFDVRLMESSNFQNQNLINSPENSFFSGHMRRVYSTGDLQTLRRDFTGQRSYSSPLAAESSSTPSFAAAGGDEQSFKVGRYSAEERKEKISKYRAKRTQRNFTKTIKYACRKTLADNRPRVRGRFARNDEVFDSPNISSSLAPQQDDDFYWNLDGLHEEEEAFVSSFVQSQPQSEMQMNYATTSFW